MNAHLRSENSFGRGGRIGQRRGIERFEGETSEGEKRDDGEGQEGALESAD